VVVVVVHPMEIGLRAAAVLVVYLLALDSHLIQTQSTQLLSVVVALPKQMVRILFF
jgi:hypothetical protein